MKNAMTFLVSMLISYPAFSCDLSAAESAVTKYLKEHYSSKKQGVKPIIFQTYWSEDSKNYLFRIFETAEGDLFPQASTGDLKISKGSCRVVSKFFQSIYLIRDLE